MTGYCSMTETRSSFAHHQLGVRRPRPMPQSLPPAGDQPTWGRPGVIELDLTYLCVVGLRFAPRFAEECELGSCHNLTREVPGGVIGRCNIPVMT